MTRWLTDPASLLAEPWALPAVAALASAGAYFVGRWLLDSRRPGAAPAGGAPGVPTGSGSGLTTMATADARPDRRAAPRREGNVVRVQLRLDPDHEPFAGLVLNRSSGGLGVLTDQPVPAQAALQVRPDRGRVVKWADAVVRSCRPEGDQFEVGLEFLGKPDWGYMMQFG